MIELDSCEYYKLMWIYVDGLEMEKDGNGEFSSELLQVDLCKPDKMISSDRSVHWNMSGVIILPTQTMPC